MNNDLGPISHRFLKSKKINNLYVCYLLLRIENAKYSFHLAQFMYVYCRPKINNKIKFELSWTLAQISTYNLLYQNVTQKCEIIQCCYRELAEFWEQPVSNY